MRPVFSQLALLACLSVFAACNTGNDTSNPKPVTPSPSPSPAPVNPSPVIPSPLPSPVLPSGPFAASTPSPWSVLLHWDAVPAAVDHALERDGKPLVTVEDTQLFFRDAYGVTAPGVTPGATLKYTLKALAANGSVVKTQALTVKTPAGPTDLGQADLPPNATTASRAYTTYGWVGPNAALSECPKWLHDTYWAFGPDNKVYPTWHPPVHVTPSGSVQCAFGHEHGQDQRQSSLLATVGPIPFGYVNEQLSPDDSNHQRNEDHVGHKVALFNGLEAIEERSGTNITCDVLFKLHQGSHSPDALKNNTHERFLNYRCSNGFEVHWKSLQAFGSPNSFKDEVPNLYGENIATNGAFPPDQPGYGADRRIEPTERSMQGHLQIHGGHAEEDNGPLFGTTQLYCDTCQPAEGFAAYVPTWNNTVWQGGPAEALKDAGGNTVVGFGGGPYWHIKNSARYYDPNGNQDPSNPNYVISRQIDQCYDSSKPGYGSRDCLIARKRNNGQRIGWDSPLSPFKATIRFNEFNFVDLINPNAENKRLFSNPFGYLGSSRYDYATVQRTRSTAFPLRQFFSVTPAVGMHISAANWAGTGQCGGSGGHGACFTEFNFYSHNGQLIDAHVHAPN